MQRLRRLGQQVQCVGIDHQRLAAGQHLAPEFVRPVVLAQARPDRDHTGTRQQGLQFLRILNGMHHRFGQARQQRGDMR
ncbi:hypothetical protein D3C71_1643110 [compost metagenome]